MLRPGRKEVLFGRIDLGREDQALVRLELLPFPPLFPRFVSVADSLLPLYLDSHGRR
jgi:hypothetical protein